MMVRLEGVTFRYEDMAMVFDLEVPRGQFLAVLGPSGAGKTTLLNLIAGFDAPLSGRIVLAGRDMAGVAPAARPVTMLFQDHNLFPHLTAFQNVGLGVHPGLRLDRAGRARVEDALAQVGLAGLGQRLPRQLSGGEARRVALARSLVREREILLLDEPFAALDPALRREMVALVDDLRRARGLTVVMVSHQVEDIAARAERAILIEAGRIAADASLEAMLAAPEGSPARRYLG
jgi:thiamine transport system ATP-binding protein